MIVIKLLSVAEETASFYLKRLTVVINAVDRLPNVAHSQTALKHFANLVAKPMELADVKYILNILGYFFCIR